MKRTHRFGHIGLFMLIFIGSISAFVMLLWNALIPDIIGWSPINYWQAMGLLVLCQLLFRGIGPHHWIPNHEAFHREGSRLHDKFKEMTWEERRNYIRQHMAGFHETETNETNQ